MIRKFLPALLISLLAVAATSTPAFALPSVDVITTVTGAEAIGPCVAGNQTFQVSADIAVTNTAEEDAVFETTDFYVTFNAGAGQQTEENVIVIDNGGFIPGQTISPGNTETYHVVVQVTLPCGVSSANLFARLTLIGRPNQVYQDSDTFISEGNPIPVGAVGGVGLAALLGLGLLLVQRRRHTRAPAAG
jgi:hypothetical protein